VRTKKNNPGPTRVTGPSVVSLTTPSPVRPGPRARSIFGTFRAPTIPFSTQYRTRSVATFQPHASTPISGTRLNAINRTTDVVDEVAWASRTARAITSPMIARGGGPAEGIPGLDR